MKDTTITIVKEYLEEYPDIKNNTELADKILEDQAIVGKSHRTIRKYIGDVKAIIEEENANIPLNSPIEEDDSDVVTDTQEQAEQEVAESKRDVPQAQDESDATEPVEEDYPEPVQEDIVPEMGGDPIEMTEEDIPDEFLYPSPYNNVLTETMSSDMFDVSNLTYHVTVSKKVYTFSVRLIDKVFCAYSRKGLNLTKHQIMTSLKIEPNEFNVIFSKLNLTKESSPYGPFTDEYMEPDDIYAAVMENTKELLGIVKDTDSATLEALIKEYKQAYVELCNRNLKYDTFLDQLSTQLSSIKITAPKLVNKNPKPFISGVDSLNIVLTDMHFGLSLPIYNSAIIEEKLNEVAATINSIGAKSVNISFLGDTVHTISGVNHSNMWKTIEPGAWGANAIIKPFEVLMNFFGKIYNLNKVISVSGNHDRMHNDRNLEESNEGALLLFYMIDRGLEDVQVIHTNHRTLHKDGNLVFINLHGDQGLDKKVSEKIIWRYGDQSKFNFILEGHFHSRIIPKDEDGQNFRKMHCPSFCPTDGYAERLGLDSVPGWLMIIERDGLPMVIDVPIQYN